MVAFGGRLIDGLARAAFSVACSLALVSCSTVPEGQNATARFAGAEAPVEMVSHVEASLRKKLAFLEKPEIESYLGRVASRLVPPGKHAIRVELVSSGASGLEPGVWVLPDGHIFFDVKTLKSYPFENEIAAAIAFAWDRAAGAGFRERLIEEAGKADPDPRRIWVFSDTENDRAIEAAVDRLYKAGYDPRGLVSTFDRAGGGNEALKEKTRRALTFYAPLLNPIVRTEDFYKMRKRLERL